MKNFKKCIYFFIYLLLFYSQIEWNLVISPGLAQPSSEANNSGMKTTTDDGLLKSRIYCQVPLIETSYKPSHRSSQDDSSMRPKFYALTNAEINNQVCKIYGIVIFFIYYTDHKVGCRFDFHSRLTTISSLW